MTGHSVPALATPVLLLLAGTLAVASPPGMVIPDDGAFALPSGDQVLYSQLDDPSGYAIADQAFEVGYASYDAEAADDFIVAQPGLQGCLVDLAGLTTVGVQSSVPVDPLFVDVAYYQDAGGMPGAVFSECDFPANPNFTSDGLGNLSIETPCSIIGQTEPYWVSQQVRQDFLTAGIHGWSTRTAAANSPAVWRNPGGGFGTPCSDWQPMNSVCGGPGTDMLFEVSFNFFKCGPPPCTPGFPGCPVPTIGPLGGILLALSLGAGSAWILRRS